MDAGGGHDYCHFDGSAKDPVDTLRGGNQWPVNPDNTWGPDHVGYGITDVNYYQRIGRIDCEFIVHQQMHLVCYDGTEKSYGPVNELRGYIGKNEVRSERAGDTQSRRF